MARAGSAVPSMSSLSPQSPTPALSQSPSSMVRGPVLDLDVLETDPVPTFLVRLGGTDPTPFEIVYCNEAFRKAGYRESVLADNRAAVLFRVWTQNSVSFQKTQQFEGRSWSSRITGLHGTWKIMREVAQQPQKDYFQFKNGTCFHSMMLECHVANRLGSEISAAAQPNRSSAFPTESRHASPDIKHPNAFPRPSPETKVFTPGTPPPPTSRPKHVSLEIISRMIEMSDVGVFEATPSGRLIHVNDAWCRLAGFTRDLLDENIDYTWMDLIYPGDEAYMVSKWNTLAQGIPDTFEMRWKGDPNVPNSVQWVLVVSVPVIGDDGRVLSVCGLLFDINPQKKAQESAAARVEALEKARQSERKFIRFAELAPIAIYIAVPDKGMTYVNDKFFELTGHTRVPFDQLSWDQIVVGEDLPKVIDACPLTNPKRKVTEPVQVRLKRTWLDQEGNRSEIWIQGSSYPELDENGSIISIMGTAFDISHFKWAEQAQRRGIEEALEAKRQQEHFIDMTSHELRNPLSAVIQCADSVISSLQQLILQPVNSTYRRQETISEELELCIDSIQTIVSCSLHQKRLIDDVLTLSKLDSNLILITPMRVLPAVVVLDSLKMFDVECSRIGIELKFERDNSLTGFEWAMLDPSRLVQVLINLVTNAIKFTKDCPTREITVTIGASQSFPPNELLSFTFNKSNAPERDMFDKPEWGNGPMVAIWLKVQDTGRGMDAEEQEKLFARFSQTTPRTHVKYGGSGLGLFISKSLSTLQGGSIGVVSEAGRGSSFAFYVAARLADGPAGVSVDYTLTPMGNRDVFDDGAMKAARLKILMVEDNVVNQKALSKQLVKAGCEVSVAGNGVEALKWLRESVYWRCDTERDGRALRRIRPTLDSSDSPIDKLPKHELDIILMDIEMPIMDGLTCARIIRDYEKQGLLGPPQDLDPPSPPNDDYLLQSSFSPGPFLPSVRYASSGPKIRLPILAVSANARGEQVLQALAAGMDDAISKPFRIPELWPKMRGLVKRLRSDAASGYFDKQLGV